MKKLFIILLLLFSCSESPIIPNPEVTGKYKFQIKTMYQNKENNLIIADKVEQSLKEFEWCEITHFNANYIIWIDYAFITDTIERFGLALEDTRIASGYNAIVKSTYIKYYISKDNAGNRCAKQIKEWILEHENKKF